MTNRLDRKRFSEFTPEEMRDYRMRWNRWEVWFGFAMLLTLLALGLIAQKS